MPLAAGVAADQQIAHAGDGRHLRRLAGADRTLIAGPQSEIAVRGGHGQHGADRGGSSTP